MFQTRQGWVGMVVGTATLRDNELARSLGLLSLEVGGADPCGSKGAKVIDVLKPTDPPENGQKGINVFFP